MKTTWGRYGALWLALVGLSTALAIPPRKDINPALLYWQAFSLFPELDDAESSILGTDKSGAVSAEERELAKRFDAAFVLIARARTQKVACDWGADAADGPEAFMPNWIKIRTAAYAGVLRARVALDDGDQARVRDELLAVSVLSRHAAGGATLVGTMIQVAVEMKILDFVAAHFEELKPQTRSEIAAGLQGVPARATVADAMVNERAGFQEWLVAQIDAVRAQETNDAKVLEKFRAVMAETFEGESDLADKIIKASGGTSAGVIRYIKAVEPYYKRSEVMARAPARDIRREMSAFESEINSSTNLLARIVLPNIGKARTKELEFEARLSKLPHVAP
jgi:hypothetical protein